MHSAVTRTLISRKNYEAKLSFAEKHVFEHVLRTESWSKVHLVMSASFIYLGLMGNILFGVKLRKD